jgi:hypothetical protein
VVPGAGATDQADDALELLGQLDALAAAQERGVADRAQAVARAHALGLLR